MTTPSELGIEIDVDWTASTPYLTTDPTWGTTYQNDVRAITISRGRSDVSQPVCSGRMTFVKGNSDGAITPLSESYTDGRPVRVTCPDDSGTRQNLFVGTIVPAGIVWSGDVDPLVTVSAHDIVGLVNQTPGGLPGTSTGTNMEAWVGAWFDARSWTTVWPGYDIDAGTADLADASTAAASTSGSGMLKTAAESEGGVLYCTRSGVLTGDDRHAPRTDTRQNQVQWRFGDLTAHEADPTGVVGIASGAMTFGHHVAYSRVAVTDSLGGVAVAESEGSTTGGLVGSAVVGTSTVGTTYPAVGRTLELNTVLADEPAAAALAGFWLALGQDRVAAFGPLGLSFWADVSDLALRCATRIELRDRVQVTWTLPDDTVVTRLLFVEQITHTITPDRWRVTLGFSSADAWVALGSDTWGIVGSALVGTATVAP